MSKASEPKALADALTGYPTVTPNQVAKFLSCTPEHVVKLIKRGVVARRGHRFG